MKLKFVLSSCLCILFCSCFFRNEYKVRLLRNNPMDNSYSVVLFSDSTKVTAHLETPLAYSSYFANSKSHVSFELKIDNNTEKVNVVRLKDIVIVNSGVDSFILQSAYSYHDSLGNFIISKTTINDNELLRINPNSSDTIALSYESIKKLTYKKYKQNFLNDTLSFFYKGAPTNVQIIGTEPVRIP